MQKITVLKYVQVNGNVPFDLWFEKLDQNIKARIDARLDRLSLGNLGDCKKIIGKLYELRFFFGSGYSVYFGKVNNEIILFLIKVDLFTSKN